MNDMFCNKCGQELPENSSFCNKCGQKLEINIVSNELDEENEIKDISILSLHYS